MNVLVINCGSSSIRAGIVNSDSGESVAWARAERVGTPGCAVRTDLGGEQPLTCSDHASALAQLLPPLLDRVGSGGVAAVGHRVVHGGDRFSAPVLIDDEVEAAISTMAALAPLHNPINLAGIRATRQLLPELPQAAVFDTAFHATIPPRARAYALPRDLVHSHGIRRYGFHGTSHAWIAAQAAAHLGESTRDLRIITCHLGNGCSATAVEYGRSVDTSMGMTPLEGLVMGTRSGDLDPGIVLELMRREGLGVEAMDRVLNHESGLRGLSGGSPDMRDVEERAARGDENSRLALQVFSHRVRRYLGAFAAVMGGVDAIAFSGGIGENSSLVRHRVAQRLEFLGARLDEERNREVRVDREHPVVTISSPHSRTRLLIVHSDEAQAVARATADLLRETVALDRSRSFPVAISARHVHLTDSAVETLFGPGHRLTPESPLSQPGQYAARERLTLIGPRRSLSGVRVVGPTRSRCQVEISRSDEFHLGLDAPVRRSGDLANTPGITLEGPAGRMSLEEGVICAQRHIHMTPGDAQRLGVEDRDIVSVALDTSGRDLVFADVVVRVSPNYRLEMHVDTDEGNAAEIDSGDHGALRPTDCTVHLEEKRAKS